MEPQRASSTVEHITPRSLRARISSSRSSHMRYSSAAGASAGCTAASAGGRPKISHPPPASTESKPRTSERKARSASASALKMTRCAPKIIGASCPIPYCPDPIVGCHLVQHPDVGLPGAAEAAGDRQRRQSAWKDVRSVTMESTARPVFPVRHRCREFHGPRLGTKDPGSKTEVKPNPRIEWEPVTERPTLVVNDGE